MGSKCTVNIFMILQLTFTYISAENVFLRSSLKEFVMKYRTKFTFQFDIDSKLKFENDEDPMQCIYKDENLRFDCYPDNYNDLNQQNCAKRGCCWKPAVQQGAPYCFYPKVYPQYKLIDDAKIPSTFYSGILKRDKPSPWPEDIKILRFELIFETINRLHFKIYDPYNERYEVPLHIQRSKHLNNIDDASYRVIVKKDPFSLSVIRKTTNNTIFTTAGAAPLIFADQYVQIGALLSSPYLYGLGEHQGSLKLDLLWNKLAFWAADQPPSLNTNLYGVHPFYLNMEEDNSANGVFLLNSNGMQVDLQDTPAITYRTTGGILDFYLFLGPTPDDVVRQYTDVVGKTFMPPFWALGFHLSRWGYNSTSGLKTVINRMRQSDIPYDVQWSDIDYMRDRLDFTQAMVRYRDLDDVVRNLHDNGQHYIPIVDPAISNSQPIGTYQPFDDGMKNDVFVKSSVSKKPIIGKVWPGTTVFPDFTNNSTVQWWHRSLKKFHETISFDGIWIDMNEPSNFVHGSIKGCPQSRYNNPPFVPKVLGGSLMFKTLCPSSIHNLSSHYNLHNLYGYMEARVTHLALDKILKKRSLIISRSTYAGSGHHGGHWTGDNTASWSDLSYSVADILNFQLFGIPMVGADICGFQQPTTPELCTRWMQLGSFYPFMRNHNSINMKGQDPAVFPEKYRSIMRSSLRLRYSLLPYLYTLFYRAHRFGDVVLKPLFFNFPSKETFPIDTQFMWGDALLISPTLFKNAVSTTAYLPAGQWFSIHTGQSVISSGSYMTLESPLDVINVHVRAGYVLPTLPPAVTTTKLRKNKFGLIVALSKVGAHGELFWDDGDNLDVFESKNFTLIEFISRQEEGFLKSVVHERGYKGPNGTCLQFIRAFGLTHDVKKVIVNGVEKKFLFNKTSQTMDITNLSVDLLKPFVINWR